MGFVNTETVVRIAGDIIDTLQHCGDAATNIEEHDRNLFKLHSEIMEYNGEEIEDLREFNLDLTTTRTYLALYTSPDYIYKYDCGDGVDRSYDYFMDSIRRIGYSCEKIIDAQGDIDTYYQEICNILDGVAVPDEAYTYTDKKQHTPTWVHPSHDYVPDKAPIRDSDSVEDGEKPTPSESQDTSGTEEDTTTPNDTTNNPSQNIYGPGEGSSEPSNDTTNNPSQNTYVPAEDSSTSGNNRIETGDPIGDLIINAIIWGINKIL